MTTILPFNVCCQNQKKLKKYKNMLVIWPVGHGETGAQ